jgi:glycosyltransferase involved in cell wall biosynthesis
VIDAVGVIVPAHNEAAVLSDCLRAIDEALGALDGKVQSLAVVVLDACSDGSERIAKRWARETSRRVLKVDFRNVGRARAAGMAHALDAFAAHERSRIWLTTTDADSIVPPTWLDEQTRLASQGAHAVAGSIRVDDWSDYPPHVGARFAEFYEPAGSDDTHRHVHGANLGIRADAYVNAGGFAPLATGEDHALWGALHPAARVSSRRIVVTTSARKRGRAPRGFSAFLAAFSATR